MENTELTSEIVYVFYPAFLRPKGLMKKLFKLKLGAICGIDMKIAILGWGSLLWDHNADFDSQHNQWLLDGPELKLEFSRVSQSRCQALTLVIDSQNGELCRVAYTFSKRKDPEDAICDLQSREGTTRKNIGFYFCDGSRRQCRDANSLKAIAAWCAVK